MCKYCDYSENHLVAVDDRGDCPSCRQPVIPPVVEYHSRMKWDSYFHKICEAVASKSPCLSRKIGAILVRDRSIVSTGYNGPPRGVPHCGVDRIQKDAELVRLLTNSKSELPLPISCPRKVLGYMSGTHMELCPAQHAEGNAVSNAARSGVSVLGCILYMNIVIPCQKCFGILINAGIKEIVVDDATALYDKHTQFLIDNSSIIIREFAKG